MNWFTTIAPICAAISRRFRARGRTAQAAHRWCRLALHACSRAHAGRNRVSLALRHPLAVEISRATTLSSCTSTARNTASIMNRRNRAPACSAAIPTGAARCGSRSTFCLIESLQKFHHYFGDDLKVEFPTGSGGNEPGRRGSQLSRRLSHLFLRDEMDGGPFSAAREIPDRSPFRDHILFYEYFHGDNGAGIGASHQTGWTALVAKLLQQSGE